MQVELIKMIDFLGAGQTQFMVPVYQRVYSWKSPQLSAWWNDISDAGRSGKPHFMGLMFYGEEAPQKGSPRRLDIIDGQQRLTTATLMLCALRDHLESTGQTCLGFDSKGIENSFLRVQVADNPECKLVLSRADAPTLRWVAGVGKRPDSDEERSKLVVSAYEWFKERFGSDSFDPSAFERGLKGLSIIAVHMEDEDRPQTVFESLNAKGLPLALPDLVRNFLLMQDGFDSPTHLFDAYWIDVENAFSTDDDDRWLTHAIRMWTNAGYDIKTDRGLFEAFKVSFAGKSADKVDKIAAGLARYCIDFHEKVAAGDEATIRYCREWEDSIGKAKRLSNNRKIFGD